MPAATSPTPRQPESQVRKISSVGSPACRQQQNPNAATSRARRDAAIMPAAYQTALGIGMIRSMAQGLRELVGRVMIDPEFLAELQRAPEPLLAQYELTEAERATVELALARLAQTPVSERRRQFSNTLISRVAT